MEFIKSNRIFLVIILIVYCEQLNAQNISNYNVLAAKLLLDYNTDTLPANNRSKPFVIKIEAYLYALGDLNEVEERLSTIMVYNMSWYDDSITWDVTEHHDIHTITVDHAIVWTPRLAMLNRHYHKHQILYDPQERVLYHNTGYASWLQILALDSTCDMDTTKFPFDQQTCKLHMYITRHGHEFDTMKVIVSEDNNSTLAESVRGSWYIQNASIVSDGITFTVTFKFKRKPLFLMISVFLPTFVLSFLTPLVFLLSNETGERSAYSITTLLAVSVYMIILSSNLPTNSSPVPLFTIMMFVWFISNSVVVLIVILNTRIYILPPHKPIPYFLQLLARKLCQVKPSRSLKEKCSLKESVRRQESYKDNDDNEDNNISIDSRFSPRLTKTTFEFPISAEGTYMNNNSGNGAETRCNANYWRRTHDREDANNDITWMDVSKAIDSFFFIFLYAGKTLFLIVVIILIIIQ